MSDPLLSVLRLSQAASLPAPPRVSSASRKLLARAAVGVVGLHCVLLAWLDSHSSVHPTQPHSPGALSVRSIALPDLPTALVVSAPDTEPTLGPGASTSGGLEPRTSAGNMGVKHADGTLGPVAPGVSGVSGVPARRVDEGAAAPSALTPKLAPASPAPGLASAAAPAPASEPSPDVPLALPAYAAMVPPPTLLNFRLRRGASQGNAILDWKVDDGRYEARLEARIAGALLLAQTSQGRYDAHGLAPMRFTDQRARRGVVAVNFQRDAGKVSFSAVPAEVEWVFAVQDRLSWLIQLVAIANAEPHHLVAQGRITLSLLGPRADSSVWHFVSRGLELDDSLGVAGTAVRLERLPESIYDTHVEVWLAAQAPHWPIRARWRNGPADPGVEMWRSDLNESR